MPITLYKNIALSDADTGGQTSTVGEPSLANRGRQIFFSGNWYATKSVDRGQNWNLVDPFTTLPSVDGGFCCDQTVLYERSRDILIWILQYVEEDQTNTLRIAVQKNPTLNNSDWYWWDFKPDRVNSNWDGEWFDYNHASTSKNYLYVGSNVFNTVPERFTRSVVFRFPLDSLASAGNLSYRYFQTSDNFSLRCVQGAKNVMYFASHNNFSQVRLFSWPENSNNISWNDINVGDWSNDMNYQAPGPDGNNWLSRCDPRITGGWVAKGKIGFAWSVNKKGNRPHPYIKVVRINEDTKSIVDKPDIWNPNYAFAYPSISPNIRGDIGISCFRGGGNFYPGHVVGTRPNNENFWSLRMSRNGTHGPNDNKWGDYVDICQYSGRGYSWFASGYTLQGGGARRNIEPRVVQFGYRRR